MKKRPRRSRPADWLEKDIERNERARRFRAQLDRAKGPSQNLEEGAEFVRFTHEFASAFKQAREVD